jgi:hypothetical protein
MTASTITASTFSLTPSIAGVVSYDAATFTATFTPSATLASGTTYTATITTGVKDLSGNPMTANKTWSFTTGSGGTSLNLLSNGDFESGNVGWTETNSAGNSNINLNTGLGHNSSNWYIYTGTVNSLTSATHQTVTIPASASQAYAQFWYKITTDETTTSFMYDTLAVQIVNPSTGSVLETLKTFSNLDATNGWVQSGQYDLIAYKGQTVRLNFFATTDSSNLTYFRMDDVLVMATAPTSTTPPTQFIVAPPTTVDDFTITPVTPQVVNSNATTSFTIIPTSGYGVLVNGCDGNLSGTIYTTGAITANCTISVNAIPRNAGGGAAQPPTITDALKVLKAIVGLTQLSPADQIRYDIAPLGSSGTPVGNGTIDVADVILILRRSIGIGSW